MPIFKEAAALRQRKERIKTFSTSQTKQCLRGLHVAYKCMETQIFSVSCTSQIANPLHFLDYVDLSVSIMCNWLHKFIPERLANCLWRESCSSPSLFSPLCILSSSSFLSLIQARRNFRCFEALIFQSFLAPFLLFHTQSFWGGLGGGTCQQWHHISESAAEPHTSSLCHLSLNKRLCD